MHKIVETDNQPLTVYITIKTNGNKKFRVWCEEYGRVNSRYADRCIKVEGKRTIYFSLPVTPKRMFFGCLNTENPQDKDFTMEIMQTPARSYDIQMDGEANSFMQFAIQFSQTCGFMNPSPNGTVIKSPDGMFTIKYFPTIIDYKTGRTVNTPARIGHKTGTIEVSKQKFDYYTIPMRVMILLHEFSHKYRNTKIGLPISHESGADVNGLYLYLGVGFSKVDAICVFGKVFLKAQTDSNIQRMRKIQDYIQRFENQEYAKLN